jgi:nucleotide-binding universal stress UspA family protein
MFDKILVPLDGSRFSSQALRYATDVAQRFSADVTLIQVILPKTLVPSTLDTEPVVESPAAIEIAMQTALMEEKKKITGAKRYLSGKVRGMKSKGIKASYKVVVGDPARTIMSFSKKEHIDLIVMTTHGKTGLRRAIMGSVADAVIRESGKPVLVIRP